MWSSSYPTLGKRKSPENSLLGTLPSPGWWGGGVERERDGGREGGKRWTGQERITGETGDEFLFIFHKRRETFPPGAVAIWKHFPLNGVKITTRRHGEILSSETQPRGQWRDKTFCLHLHVA